MATRRSRLQFRPNVGPKTGKAVLASGSAPVPSRPKDDGADKDVLDTETKGVDSNTNCQTASLVPETEIPTSATSSPSASKITADDNQTKEVLVQEETVGSSVPVTVKDNSDTSKNEVPERSDTPESKHEAKPKPVRSRFPKARPNVSDSGRPKISRTSTSQNVTSVSTTTVVSSPVLSNVPQPETNDNTKEKSVPASPVKQSSANTAESPAPAAQTESEESQVKPKNVENSAQTKSSTQQSAESTEKTVKAKTERRKEHRAHKILPSTDEPPNRQKLTMGDLIYWNPRTNVLKPKIKNKSVTNSPRSEPATIAATPPVAQEPQDVDDGDDDSMPVPQVKIGPDGNIILNEESLVIDNQEKDKTEDMEIVEEDESRPCGGFYGNRIQSRRWNVMETKQFYRALSTVGTDFTMLMKLFPDRSRKEIKNKFKKEEKFHRILVDKAIDQRHKFDMAILEKFEQERKDYLEFVKSEEIKVKQQKINAKLEKKKIREEKRKERMMKENLVRRSQRKRRKTMYDDVPEELEEGAADRHQVGITDELHTKHEEVVEILVSMSCSRQEQVDSSEDSEKPSSEAVPFVPGKVKPAASRITDVQEDATVDLEVCTTPQKDASFSPPKSVIHGHSVSGNIVMQQIPEQVHPVIEVDHTGQLRPPSESVSGNDASDKKVQMILVPEESAGQTVIHVYIVPDGADSVTVDGRTVMLSPTHTPGHLMSPSHTGAHLMSPTHNPSHLMIPQPYSSSSQPTEIKSRHTAPPSPSHSSSYFSSSSHQNCNPAPCFSLDRVISNYDKNKDSERQGVHKLSYSNRAEVQAEQNMSALKSFEISNSSISALHQKSQQSENKLAKSQVASMSQTVPRICPQTPVIPAFKISSAKSFTPLPSQTEVRTIQTNYNERKEEPSNLEIPFQLPTVTSTGSTEQYSSAPAPKKQLGQNHEQNSVDFVPQKEQTYSQHHLKISNAQQCLMSPAGDADSVNKWTRKKIISPDHQQLYCSVDSEGNILEVSNTLSYKTMDVASEIDSDLGEQGDTQVVEIISYGNEIEVEDSV